MNEGTRWNVCNYKFTFSFFNRYRAIRLYIFLKDYFWQFSRSLHISSKFSNLLAHNYSYYFLIIHFTFVRLVVNFSFIPDFSNLSLLFIFLSFFFFSWSVCASNPHLLTFNPKNLAGFFVSYNNIFIDVLEFSILTVSQIFFLPL